MTGFANETATTTTGIGIKKLESRINPAAILSAQRLTIKSLRLFYFWMSDVKGLGFPMPR